MDWAEACRILGISEAATETEVKEQYLYKVQLLHPDKNQDKPEGIRKKAEVELSLVNQAYSFINNNNNNPYKYPPKLSVDPPGIRFKDVGIGQRKTTTFTVNNTGGPYTSIWIENQPAPWLTVTGVKSITPERLPLEVALECIGTGEPGKQYICDLPVRLENENTRSVDQTAVKVELMVRPGTEASAKLPDLTVSGPSNSSQPSGSAADTNQTASPFRETPVQQPTVKNTVRFSATTFAVDLMAFTIIGIAATIASYVFLDVNDTAFWIGLTLFTTIAFAVSINHSFSAGPSNKRNWRSRKKYR